MYLKAYSSEPIRRPHYYIDAVGSSTLYFDLACFNLGGIIAPSNVDVRKGEIIGYQFAKVVKHASKPLYSDV